MPTSRFIIYCDESIGRGRKYSNFYGGILVRSEHLNEVETRLKLVARQHNIQGEIKWTKTAEAYEQKYIAFMDEYFDLIAEGKAKVRIMFSDVRYKPQGLTDYHDQHRFFMLYYQLIKNAFGLKFCTDELPNGVDVQLLLDRLPDKKAKSDVFKRHIASISSQGAFRQKGIRFPKGLIGEVDSHDHIILQGLDVNLGAIQFRLNDQHLVIPQGKRYRGKRTRSKERLYKHINSRLRQLRPHFNIGTSTGRQGGITDLWEHQYRHWLFMPKDAEYDPRR